MQRIESMFEAVLMCFSHYLGIRFGGGGGGGVPRATQPHYAISHPRQLKSRNFRKLLFIYMGTTQNEHPSYVKHV